MPQSEWLLLDEVTRARMLYGQEVGDYVEQLIESVLTYLVWPEVVRRAKAEAIRAIDLADRRAEYAQRQAEIVADWVANHAGLRVVK